MSRLLGDASIPKRAPFHIDFDAPQNPSTAKREREGPIAKRWEGEGSRGRTRTGRAIFVVHTLRHINDEVLIRPISARYMHAKELQAYEKDNPNL